MKERPVIFNGEMVRAILDGRKTMTRRVIKSQPDVCNGVHENFLDSGEDLWTFDFHHPGSIISETIRCPYGGPGDRLYISERIKWLHPVNYLKGRLRYLSDTTERQVEIPYRCKTPKLGVWRGRTLPPEWARPERWEITDVRVERVQEISEEDILAEGIQLQERILPNGKSEIRVAGIEKDTLECLMAWGLSEGNLSPERIGFTRLWNSINAKRGFGWDVNPWVWVVEFKKI